MARKSSKGRKSAEDKFAPIVDGFIAALEKGVKPWACPWDRSFGLPRNGKSGNQYNGINIFILWGAAAVNGWTDPRYYTFDQAKEANGFKAEWVEGTKYGRPAKVKQWRWTGKGDAPCEPWECGVRKGSKGTKIIFAGGRKVTEKDDNGNETERYFRTFKVWTVFNHQQLDWAKGKEVKPAKAKVSPKAAHKAAAALFEPLPADVRHGGTNAGYSPKGDFIMLPPVKAFNSGDNYWATRAHETVHWTGHRNRCGRQLDTRFGSEAYAFEELIAELGAAFLCAEAGINGEHLQHESYLAAWIKVLKGSPRALFEAAKQARQAVAWVKGDEEAKGKGKGKASTGAVADILDRNAA